MHGDRIIRISNTQRSHVLKVFTTIGAFYLDFKKMKLLNHHGDNYYELGWTYEGLKIKTECTRLNQRTGEITHFTKWVRPWPRAYDFNKQIDESYKTWLVETSIFGHR